MIRHLYIHVPFCARICPYCAFHVHRGGVEEHRAFVAALRREWRAAREEFPLGLETIYFGGETPSILSAELFSELAEELPRERAIPEFTLEVNPATVTEAKARAWRAAGVNRISLGAQSFDAAMLELLGRQHGPKDVAETCDLLRAHGFENINIDLMFALPGQSLALWESTLAAALAYRPEHVSAYALTYEEDTPFFEKRGLWRLEPAPWAKITRPSCSSGTVRSPSSRTLGSVSISIVRLPTTGSGTGSAATRSGGTSRPSSSSRQTSASGMGEKSA